MLEKFDMYFGQGFNQLKSGVVLSVIIYAVIFAALLIFGKEKKKERYFLLEKLLANTY